MYKEFWIDSAIGRPFTYLEERALGHLKRRNGVVHASFVWSDRLGMFWPESLFKFAVRNLIKHYYVSRPNYYYYPEGYMLTDHGRRMLSVKEEEER